TTSGDACGSNGIKKNNTMNIGQIIMGSVMSCIGILIVIFQIKWFKKGLKDQFGYQGRFLLGGIGFIVIGIIVIVKSF
ncbi:MAG: hypothetical protein ACHQIM_17955, partial [Sphingobacteriales bacterium]